MSTLRSIISYDLSCRCLGNHGRSQSLVCNQQWLLAISTPKSRDGCSFLANNGGLSLLRIRLGSNNKSNVKMDAFVRCARLPPQSHSGPWKRWILGVLLLTSFYKLYWGFILPIKREVDKAVERIETATGFVENAAMEVEKVAREIADQLPKGEARDVVLGVEEIAEETAKDVEAVEDVIQKVEVAETLIDPLGLAKNKTDPLGFKGKDGNGHE